MTNIASPTQQQAQEHEEMKKTEKPKPEEQPQVEKTEPNMNNAEKQTRSTQDSKLCGKVVEVPHTTWGDAVHHKYKLAETTKAKPTTNLQPMPDLIVDGKVFPAKSASGKHQHTNGTQPRAEPQFLPELNPENVSQRVLVQSQTTVGVAQEYQPEIRMNSTRATADRPGLLEITLVCTNLAPGRGKTAQGTTSVFATRDNSPIWFKLVSRNHPATPSRPEPVVEWLNFRVDNAQASQCHPHETGMTKPLAGTHKPSCLPCSDGETHSPTKQAKGGSSQPSAPIASNDNDTITVDMDKPSPSAAEFQAVYAQPQGRPSSTPQERQALRASILENFGHLTALAGARTTFDMEIERYKSVLGLITPPASPCAAAAAEKSDSESSTSTSTSTSSQMPGTLPSAAENSTSASETSTSTLNLLSRSARTGPFAETSRTPLAELP